jgi:DNA polymerase-3 subunit delta
MYKNELDNHIRNKTISNSFVFFGESHFLIEMYTQMLTSIEGANVLSLYHDEYNFKSAKAHLSQASLFGDRNILIIKTEKKIPKKELDILLELCEKNKDNIFVYAYFGSDHKSYNNKKAFSKFQTMSVRFYHPKEYEALSILQHLAQEKKIQIDKYTLTHLLHIHHNDIALCANELEKFTIFSREITTKDVDNLVFGLHEINLDDFIQKLLQKKDFKEDIHQLLERGEDEIRIINAITAYMTQLYMFNIYIRINGSPNAVDILGYNPPKQIVQAKAQQAIKLKLKTYYEVQQLLLESELQMKSSSVDKSAILYSTLIRLQKLI